MIIDAIGCRRNYLAKQKDNHHGPKVDIYAAEPAGCIALDHDLIDTEKKPVENHEADVHKKDRQVLQHRKCTNGILFQRQ